MLERRWGGTDGHDLDDLTATAGNVSALQVLDRNMLNRGAASTGHPWASVSRACGWPVVYCSPVSVARNIQVLSRNDHTRAVPPKFVAALLAYAKLSWVASSPRRLVQQHWRCRFPSDPHQLWHLGLEWPKEASRRPRRQQLGRWRQSETLASDIATELESTFASGSAPMFLPPTFTELGASARAGWVRTGPAKEPGRGPLHYQ